MPDAETRGRRTRSSASTTQPAATAARDLRPTQPPGRRSRKARTYGDQIRQLHAEGYSLELIREALADAGIVVGKSTVQREAARRGHPTKPQQATTGNAEAQAVDALEPCDHPLVASPGSPSQQPRGKDVAEAFMNAHISNRLLRKDKP